MVTNRTTPTGGVIMPMVRLTARMIPKWIGSTPTDVARGSSSGVKMTRALIVSMNVPTKSRIRLMMSSIMNQPGFRDAMAAVTCCGMPSTVSSHEKMDAVPRMNRILPVSRPHSYSRRGISGQVSSWYTKSPRTKA